LFLVIVVGMTATYLLIAEIAKSWFYRREARRGDPVVVRTPNAGEHA